MEKIARKINHKKGNKFLEKAAKDKLLLFLQHDVENEIIEIGKESGKFKLNKTFKLEDI